MNEPKLDERQKRFCQLYFGGKHSNAECVRLAGFSPAGASAVANRLLKRASIQAYLSSLKDLAGPPQPEPLEIKAAAEFLEQQVAQVRGELKAVRDATQCLMELDALADDADAIENPVVRLQEKRRTLLELMKQHERMGAAKKDDNGGSVAEAIKALGGLFGATPDRDK
jgi:hypothetical protein